MNPPANFQLEEFFLSSLHLDHKPPTNGENDPSEVSAQFDYTIGVHNVKKNHFRMALKVKIQEYKDDKTPIGITLASEIIGFFSLDESIPQPEMEFRARTNGLSVLYGLLRGTVASCTGLLQGGKFIMPSINPQEIVQNIEERRAEEEKESKAAKASGT